MGRVGGGGLGQLGTCVMHHSGCNQVRWGDMCQVKLDLHRPPPSPLCLCCGAA
jgi:hypothetical protein